MPDAAHRGMFDPKTPFQAAAIFLTGVAVIAWTTRDIDRVTRQNRPMTPEQMEQLKQFGRDARQKAAGIDQR